MPKTFDYYISKGFDEKMARYFADGRKKIVSVLPKRDFLLELAFEGGEKRIFDVKPLLKDGSVFEPLRDADVFSKVRLDENGNVCWPSAAGFSDKIDISADVCYVEGNMQT